MERFIQKGLCKEHGKTNQYPCKYRKNYFRVLEVISSVKIALNYKFRVCRKKNDRY
jgi:hypothetical protein